jgi:hypothetical protein
MTRAVRVSVVILVLAACGSDKPPVGPPKRPATELIVGEFERRPPDGTTAIRFRADGSVLVAHERAKLDRESLASGTWKLDGDQLTLTYDKGMCADGSPGVYKVVVSKIGVHFGKVEDRCDQRAKIDNQTWWRIH